MDPKGIEEKNERTQNSVLAFAGIEILGNGPFLLPVLVKRRTHNYKDD